MDVERVRAELAPDGDLRAGINMANFLLVTGRSWRGTAFGGVKGRTELPTYVDRYMNGRIKLDEFVTITMPLDDINTAFDKMHEGEVIRSVVLF